MRLLSPFYRILLFPEWVSMEWSPHLLWWRISFPLTKGVIPQVWKMTNLLLKGPLPRKDFLTSPRSCAGSKWVIKCRLLPPTYFKTAPSDTNSFQTIWRSQWKMCNFFQYHKHFPRVQVFYAGLSTPTWSCSQAETGEKVGAIFGNKIQGQTNGCPRTAAAVSLLPAAVPAVEKSGSILIRCLSLPKLNVLGVALKVNVKSCLACSIPEFLNLWVPRIYERVLNKL